MPRSFDVKKLRERLPGGLPALRKDPRTTVRLVLGALLLANVVAAVLVVRPLGGSPEELERREGELRLEVQQRQAALQRLRALAAKVEKGRQEADRFMTEYFMTRRSASSGIVSELTKAAQQAGIKPREHAFVFEPVEGSDTLSMMTITANYEGTYADLVQFINLLDRSPRFLIMESLQAAPQQAAGMLNVNMKVNTFVREEGPAGETGR